jgi:hypothetical protein
LKAEGDVVFSIRSIDTINSDEDKETIESYHLQKGEELVWVSYTEKGIRKEITEKSDVDVTIDFEYHRIPEKTIESTMFLSAIAMCAPYLDSAGGYSGNEWHLSRFCLESNKIIATDKHRLIVAKDIDINPLVFYNKKGKVTDRFLLQGNVSLLLPKSGSCQLASRIESIWQYNEESSTQTERNVTVLYIVFPDYYILTTGNSLGYSDWHRVTDEKIDKDAHRLHIDPRDAQMCIKQLKMLPKSKFGERAVHLHFEEGRLCADSRATDTSNIRLRFSEHTTGSIASETIVDNISLGDALQYATEVFQNPTRDVTLLGTTERKVSPLHFESDIATIAVMPSTKNSEAKKITSVVEMKEHWEQQVKKSVVKKPTVQKQPKSNALFASADRDIIVALRLENEQLKKEIEMLRSNKKHKNI